MKKSSSRIAMGTLAIAAIAAVGLYQAAELPELRAQNQQLQQKVNEAKSSTTANASSVEPKDDQDRSQLLAATRDLHKVRSEFAQLRSRPSQLGKLRSENERLKKMAESVARTGDLNQLPGFVAKETWADAGFTSPEATVKTYFWAMRQGNLEKMVASMVPEVGARFGRTAEAERKEMAQFLGALRGYRVVGSAAHNADQVELEIGLGLGVLNDSGIPEDKTFKMPLQRINGEWKISGEPR